MKWRVGVRIYKRIFILIKLFIFIFYFLFYIFSIFDIGFMAHVSNCVWLKKFEYENCWDVICFEYIWLCTSHGHHRVASPGFELRSKLYFEYIWLCASHEHHRVTFPGFEFGSKPWLKTNNIPTKTFLFFIKLLCFYV